MRSVLIGFALITALASCKGHREFREARKELKKERAERKNAQHVETEGRVDDFWQNEALFFAMGRTACFGTCPVYHFYVHKDGSAFYEGIAHVAREGRFEARASQDFLNRIQAAAEETGFMLMLDSYDNSLITDLPAIEFGLRLDGGALKRVLCRIQCPERLQVFAVQIDEWIEELEWQPVQPEKDRR